MEELINISNRLINHVNTSFHRSLIKEIEWNQRLIEIRGSRGVGKTTLMLQKAKSISDLGEKVLYASLDLPFFFNENLFDIADNYVKFGGKYLFLDEVHRYPSKNKDSDWSLEIKNIYDSFPELNIVFSGSSILQLYQGRGDLSRRKASYMLNGLSFREFLEMNGMLKIEIITFENLIKNHEKIATEIVNMFRPLPAFKQYLASGYFPFYSGNEDIYYHQLKDIINLIIDVDLPYLSSISQTAREQLKRLLGAISTTVPYVPNMKNLAELINVSDHRTLLKYLQLLHEAQIISLVKSDLTGNKQLQKPEKILIHNTNLIHALGFNNLDIGTKRETFFFNQTSSLMPVTYSGKADFLVKGKYLFEVGGKNKKQKQIAGIQNSFIAMDDIEIGFGNKIPLWLFGFLY
jgi:predicted AAA+ superfamily ATPase